MIKQLCQLVVNACSGLRNSHGIAPDMMPSLRDPLFTMKDFGVKLGLSLVKILVGANGGSVAVSGAVGIGSTFTACPGYSR